MCYSGKCDFERWDGECNLEFDKEKSLLLREMNFDPCLYGHYQFMNLPIDEVKEIEKQKKQIDFILSLKQTP